MNALPNANFIGIEKEIPCIGVKSNDPPEVNCLQKGVSVDYAQDLNKQWFVLRITYGRTNKAYHFITENNMLCFLPMRKICKIIHDKKQYISTPLLPGLLFVYTTKECITSLLKKTCRNDYIKFYYDHFKENSDGKNPPLIIKNEDMLNFMKAVSIENEHTMIVTEQQCHYKSGDIVEIIKGDFIGVRGYVARVSGQQRVVVQLSNLCLVATAYIPTDFIRKL